MLDFIVIPHPINFPQACIACMGQKGPVLVTHRALPGYGDVYVCESCAKRISRAFGFADGKRLDELSSAAKTVNERDRDIAGLSKQLTEYERKLGDAVKRGDDLEADVAFFEGRVSLLEGRLREAGHSALELVGGEAS